MLFTVLLAASVTFTATDGRQISGTWTPALGVPGKARLPAVLLVPDSGHPRSEWTATAAALAKAGVASLAIDPRALAADAAFEAASPDTDAALAFLGKRDGVDPTRVLVAGAGSGGLVALYSASRNKDIAGVALVSPALDKARFDDVDAIADYGARPLFIAVGRGDKAAAMSALVLDGESKSPPAAKKLRIDDGSRSGTALLQGETLESFVLWVKQRCGLAPVETPAPPP